MSDPYLGEIRLFANTFAPQGWALCDGSILQIAQNQALFALLGTVYGGDGKTTFALPDLRGRVPIHFNSTFPLGNAKGEETHTLTNNEMPVHTHFIYGSSSNADQSIPTGYTWAVTTDNIYGPASSVTTMNPSSISNAGQGQAHGNMQPYLVLNFCIATQGIFPTRS